ncbi:putative SOS response-associated peptidase YedK [Inhella inkyongensis]|uniref:Abasic site processing protein n=1 Tax=Inhella inkyongensis TaxID=392593 RepID=A0A840S334_9BURK|nr:SOS response-associated peptidase family protein [Inhella inkyongensis]MBB5204735.1 putative SOS response-associated peptidase YedK [Inhella inkyongensis]
MCTRYIPPDMAALERFWHIGRHNPPALWPAEVFPRQNGPFIRAAQQAELARELLVGPWALLPFDKRYATSNARREGVETRATSRRPWAQGQRCIIPALSFDEPCWESGRCVWWRFRRADGEPLSLAGLWSTAIDPSSGARIPVYTMLTVNADHHPLMRRMHKPDPKLPPEAQDKRSVVVLEPQDLDRWLHAPLDQATALLRAPDDAGLVGQPL